MKAKQRERVHFVFRAHPSGERYLPKKYDQFVDTLVVEHATGFPNIKITRFGLPSMFPSEYEQTTSAFFRGLKKRGGTIIVGEQYKNILEKWNLSLLDRSSKLIISGLEKNSLKKFKIGLMLQIEFYKLRHKLIRRTIKKEYEEQQVIGILARYGTAHSVLTAELSKEGIKSSRDIDSIQFNHEAIVYRKAILGKKISKSDIKKAFISRRTWPLISNLFPIKLHKHATPLISLSFELVEKLTEQQIDEIIKSGDTKLIFELNNLPRNPTHAQLMQWLDANSVFWKTHYGSRVKERKQEIFEARRKKKKNR